MTNQRRLLEHWEAPEVAGEPLRCLTTTFTYEADFFQKQCLGRFLRLEGQYGEVDDLSFVIEQEERLAQVPVTVVVDRSYGAEPRNLRWDVLPVHMPRGGVQHAKVTLLLWEGVARFVVASANLVEASYRSNVEAAIVLDASEGSRVPLPVVMALIDALGGIVRRTPRDVVSEHGPARRARETLQLARQIVSEAGLPERPGRGEPHLAVLDSSAPVLPRLAALLRGGPPRRATVLSPFFDVSHGDGAAANLGRTLARRGPASAAFVVPVDYAGATTVIRAPRALRGALPRRIDVSFHEFALPGDERGRRLHGKAIALENDRDLVVLIGSSNFTSAGLAVEGHTANAEVGVAIRVRADRSRVARDLRGLFAAGSRLRLDEGEWDALEDQEEAPALTLPLGFRGFLLEPGEPHVLYVDLNPDGLPAEWRIDDSHGNAVTDSVQWEAAGRPKIASHALAGPHPPFFVHVEWTGDDGAQRRVAWPINVTDQSKLPPPEELRDLPAEVLIAALRSTRPVHEALAAAIRGRRRAAGKPGAHELDPLKRYSGTGRFLQRAREVAAALEALEARLGRPASSAEALGWRLTGPIGPLALARALVAEASGGRTVPGEVSFLLAEIAMTLGRVDWNGSKAIVGRRTVREQLHATLSQLRELRAEAEREQEVEAGLRHYVERAFERAVG